MTQTAVEWLVRKLSTELIGEIPLHRWDEIREAVQQAKQMEREQHQETFKQSRQAKIFEEGMPPVWESFEQYYNETYGTTK